MGFSVWTMITVAVIVGCMIPILGILASMQEKRLKYGGASDGLKRDLDETRADLDRANARIDAMGERINVLERLATDQDAELNRSLDKLKHDAERASI